MIDAHCHLERMENPEEVVEEAKERGMAGIVTSAPNFGDYQKNLELSAKYRGFVHSCLGLHPDDAIKTPADDLKKMVEMIHSSEIVGIGEIGLDYHWIKGEAERRESMRHFEMMVDVANGTGKPVVIHCRDAWDDCLRILKRADVPVMLHCFTGKKDVMLEAVDRGYYISFSTLLVKSKGIRKVAKHTPLENIVLETDAPWLDPFSSELVNRPWKISFTSDRIAKEKGLPVFEVEQAALKNTRKLFKI